jgi:HEAT repeat protein
MMQPICLLLLVLSFLQPWQNAVADAPAPNQVSQLILNLKSKDKSNQIKSVRELGLLGVESQEAIPDLIQTLRSEPLEKTELTSEIISTLEKEGVNLAELLVKSIDNQDEVLSTHLAIHLKDTSGLKTQNSSELVKKRLVAIDPTVRRIAIDAISILRTSDSESARLLIDLARDKDLRVSYRAISALGSLSPTKKEIIRALTLLTKSSSPAIRYRAIVSLGEIGKDAKISLPNLKSIANSGNGPIAKKAEEAVALIEEKEVPQDTDTASARAAMSRTQQMPEIETAVETVNLPVFSSPDQNAAASNTVDPNQESESSRLAKIKIVDTSAQDSVNSQTLLAGLNDSSPTIQKEAVTKLTQFPSLQSPELAEALRSKFSDSDPQIRDNASKALIKLGSDGMKEMIRLSNSSDPAVKLRAIKALRNFDRPLTTEAVIQLKENLKDQNETIRSQSAVTLGMSNSVPNETIPLLISSLHGSDLSTAVSATIALSKFNHDAVKPLLTALNSDNPMVRSRAITAFGLMETPPDDIVEILTPLLTDESSDVRASAQQALKSINASASQEE